jgi:hypothetical protein
LRLWLSAFAYLLLERVRTLGCRGTELARATAGTIRLKLFKVAAQVKADTEKTLKDLAPWIERMRADHIKYIVQLSRKALGRVDQIFATKPPAAPKDESFAAQAIDKHDAIIRRNLGMGEQNSTNSLNVNVLVAGGRSVHDPNPPTLEIQNAK